MTSPYLLIYKQEDRIKKSKQNKNITIMLAFPSYKKQQIESGSNTANSSLVFDKVERKEQVIKDV